MCGINGFFTRNILTDPTAQLRKMNNLIIHRGPDAEGVFIEEENHHTLAMGMRRLSIIDLHSGNQPIYSADKSKIIVFNGEIYNYLALRNDLVARGCNFTTNSDTEVILKLYEKEGVASFGKLDGMFAFSIYDKTCDKIIIARDFFGEKPLYYTHANGDFIWASELKSIISVLAKKPDIDAKGLSLYFQLTYIPAPFTIYKKVSKLEANHLIEFDCKSQTFVIAEVKQQFEKGEVHSKKSVLSKTHDLVFNSVISRSISDVPIGTFLSGGVDSSIIALCAAKQSTRKIDTFSLGFEKKSFDESNKSQTVAKLIGSDHQEFIIGENDLAEDMHRILINFDEPFADSSALPSFVVAEKTSRHVKVALTGDGGDEVFGGYNKYYIGKLNERYTQLVPSGLHHSLLKATRGLLNLKEDNRGFRFKVNRMLKAINYDGDFYLNIVSLGYQEDELGEILLENFYDRSAINYYKKIIGSKNKTLSDFRNIDRLISLEGDMLTKVDRTSMLNSLECRAPFLNKKLWSLTEQLPDRFLINGWDKKHILKEAFKGYFPKNFLNSSKKGFGVPVGDWLKTSLKAELLSYVESDFLVKQGIFKQDKLLSIVMNHLSGTVDNTFRVWTFFCFQKWYKNIYDD